MPYEHLTCVNDARLAPYARVRDADLAAWPDAPAGLFMAESRAVIAAAIAAVQKSDAYLFGPAAAEPAPASGTGTSAVPGTAKYTADEIAMRKAADLPVD